MAVVTFGHLPAGKILAVKQYTIFRPWPPRRIPFMRRQLVGARWCCRKAMVVKHIKTTFPSYDNIITPVLVHICDIEFHSNTDDVIRRRIDSFFIRVMRQMVKWKYMPFKLTAFDIVPESIQRLESPNVTAMMGKKALTSYQISSAVAI